MFDRIRIAPTAHRPWRRSATLLTAVALTALAACGSESDGTGDAATTPATSEAAPQTSEAAPGGSAGTTGSDATDTEAGPQDVTVSAFDFGYELPTTEFEAGEPTIELVNDGDASHNIVVERDGEDVAGTDIIGSGETTSLTVDLEPGEYVFYCSVANHRALGMEVTVTVD